MPFSIKEKKTKLLEGLEYRHSSFEGCLDMKFYFQFHLNEFPVAYFQLN